MTFKAKPIQVQFDPEARAILDQMRTETGAPDIATVVKRALGFYQWGLERRRQGFRIGAYMVDSVITEVDLDSFQ